MAPLYPLAVDKSQDFSHKQVYLSMGKMDPICSMEQNQVLLDLFDELGIQRELKWVQTHELTVSIVEGYTNWYFKQFSIVK